MILNSIFYSHLGFLKEHECLGNFTAISYRDISQTFPVLIATLF